MDLIRIDNGLMFVVDDEGHGHNCHILKTFDTAKEQLQQWQETYAFDRDEAIVLLAKFFKDEPAGEEITRKSVLIVKILLKIPTLAARNAEELDCHILHVQEIALILRAAYELGRASAS